LKNPDLLHLKQMTSFLSMDWIWYAGALTALIAHIRPETKLLIFGLHMVYGTLDWWHRKNHNRQLRELNRRLLVIEQQLRAQAKPPK
jgi:hypothetical protein